VTTYRNRIASVTPASVQTALRQLVRPDGAVIVVVGDATVLRDRLARVAPVRVVDPNGDPLVVAAATTRKTGGVAIDASKLVPGSDSSTIMLQGNPFGSAVKVLERGPDAITVTERAVLGAMMKQSTTLTFSPTGEVRSVMQTGTMQGQATKIDATYANGRVKGSATTASQAGPKSITFDTTVAPGTVDENAVTAIVPGLPWSRTATFTIPIFSPGEGIAKTFNMRVTGTQSVTVPAGTFDAYAVEMTGGQLPLMFYVTTAQPYRIVKSAPVGAPLEIVLVK
jgi:hypothetical protein